MAVSKRILGIAAAAALCTAVAPEAKAASTIKFIGGQANIDFGAFDAPSFSTTAAALCPGEPLTGTCSSGGTGIFAGFNGYAALDNSYAIFVTTTSGATLPGGTPDAYAKPLTGTISPFNVIGGPSPIFVSPLSGFTGQGFTIKQSDVVFARSLAPSGPIPVTVTGTFGTRSGSVVFNSFYGNYTSATGGLTYSFNIANEITLTVDEPSRSAVPAPLPILGAASAFGFSRKLRKRIKLAA